MTGAAEPVAPTLPCRCAHAGHDDGTCVCSPLERWARSVIAEPAASPPLSVEARRYMARQIERVSGYPSREPCMGFGDGELARLWLESMLDFCRDKGLVA